MLIFSIITSWGLWAFFTKLAVEKIGIQSSFWVNVLVLILVTLYLFASRQLIPLKEDSVGIALAVIAGIMGGLGTILFYMLLSKNQVGPVVAITALYPLVTIILATIFLKEVLSPLKIFGIILALGAIFLLNL